MAKRTAVIDIGSNSARMAVFEKTSRFGFHLIKEIKSRVRVGEGAYERGGQLQSIPMDRTFDTLKEFKDIASNLKCKKLLCVATSALRDAPNRSVLTKKIKQQLDINVKIIDGKKEAYFGGVATLNLLPKSEEATTIDIGGGSTELAKIQNGKIIDTISLNIGTVRLKELFFDKKVPTFEALEFVNQEISKIPKHFSSDTIFGIGGTIRALSSSIMDKNSYPIDTVHGFTYKVDDERGYLHGLMNSGVLKLKSYSFKKDRYDTIREGCVIFYALLNLLNAKKVTTSGAGVREGVYLCDLLRGQNHKFPENFNPSVRSLTDRFILSPKDNNYVARKALKIFDALRPLHGLDDFQHELTIAAKLHNVGQALSFYQYHSHGYHFILNNLNFGFTHEEKMLIALLIKYNSKKLPKHQDINNFQAVLPCGDTINWLSFMLSFANKLNIDLNQSKCEFEYKNNTLHVKSESKMTLAKEEIRKLVKPASFAIIFDCTKKDLG